MAGMGAGYDLSVSTFSPDGRVFQVEYAEKAVETTVLCLGVVCMGGVVFAAEKQKQSPLLITGTNKRIHKITPNIGVIIAGLLPDGRQLVHRIREECRSYKQSFGVEIPLSVLAERAALFMHAYTLYWHVRPFGAAVMIGGIQSQPNDGQPKIIGELYSIDPSGCCSRYTGTALGKGQSSGKTEIEKLDLSTLSVKDAVHNLIKIFIKLNEDYSSGQNAKKIEFEVACMQFPSDTSNLKDAGMFSHIEQSEISACIEQVKAELDNADSD